MQYELFFSAPYLQEVVEYHNCERRRGSDRLFRCPPPQSRIRRSLMSTTFTFNTILPPAEVAVVRITRKQICK